MKQIVEPGQIWEVVTDDFLTNKDKRHFNRQIKLEKGEKIEIRYPFAWNFRTMDNNYFHSSEEMILENCRLFGTIIPFVKQANKANLEEILRLKLFEIAK
jgi:hypothetical protein